MNKFFIPLLAVLLLLELNLLIGGIAIRFNYPFAEGFWVATTLEFVTLLRLWAYSNFSMPTYNSQIVGKLSLRKIITRLNVSKVVANHLIGKGHSTSHRLTIGFIIMVVGVVLSKWHYSNSLPAEVCTDVLGYSLHGLGLTSWLEVLLKLEE